MLHVLQGELIDYMFKRMFVLDSGFDVTNCSTLSSFTQCQANSAMVQYVMYVCIFSIAQFLSSWIGLFHKRVASRSDKLKRKFSQIFRFGVYEHFQKEIVCK